MELYNICAEIHPLPYRLSKSNGSSCDEGRDLLPVMHFEKDFQGGKGGDVDKMLE